MSFVIGDALEELRKLPGDFAQMCVTSPPYWGLRDYGVDGQIGLEETPGAYVERMVAVFREVRRVLRDDGTLWINLGDSYATGAEKVGDRPGGGGRGDGWQGAKTSPSRLPIEGLKPKDLVGIPWRVAFALQADGWYLRSEIIWHKPNPMPESATDRPTRSHEHLFLLSKSEIYYYDAESIKEPSPNGGRAIRLGKKSFSKGQAAGAGTKPTGNALKDTYVVKDTRNKRTVWTAPTRPYDGAHFACYPPKLISPCIMAGAPVGGMVLDPFLGSGTTGMVAQSLGRQWFGIDINPEYAALIRERTSQMGLFGINKKTPAASTAVGEGHQQHADD